MGLPLNPGGSLLSRGAGGAWWLSLVFSMSAFFIPHARPLSSIPGSMRQCRERPRCRCQRGSRRQRPGTRRRLKARPPPSSVVALLGQVPSEFADVVEVIRGADADDEADAFPAARVARFIAVAESLCRGFERRIAPRPASP